MNITREEKGKLTAEIKIAITGADYEESVNKILKDYQKKAQVPGFRPGKVPFGMVKKMYGEAVKFDEINKLVSDSLTNYITEEKLDILGQPLPAKQLEQSELQQETVEFVFEVGLAPEIELELNKQIKIEYIDVQVADETLDEEVQNTLKRFGTQEQPEVSAEGDLINGKFDELDAEGNIKEEGVTNTTSLGMSFFKNEDTKKQFMGLKIDDTVDFTPLEAIENEEETAHMLGIDKENAGLGSAYRFTVTEIQRTVPAELNEELYKKAFPADEINSEEDFRNRLSEEVKKMYDAEADRLYTKKAIEKVIEEAKLELPDEFLKRWLVDTNENLTAEQVESDYENFSKSMQWQLLENKLIKENDIKVTEEDVRNHYKNYFMNSMMAGDDQEDEQKDAYLNSIVDNLMKNQEEVKRVYDFLYDTKLTALFKKKLGRRSKKVNYDKFVEIVTKENQN
jgi:trigger factor